MAQQQPDPMAATRRAVAASADELQRRSTNMKLDEKKGAADWWRLRAEFQSEVRTAGQDWLAAFNFTGNIAPAAQYNDAQVLLDDANGAPVPMLNLAFANLRLLFRLTQTVARVGSHEIREIWMRLDDNVRHSCSERRLQ